MSAKRGVCCTSTAVLASLLIAIAASSAPKEDASILPWGLVQEALRWQVLGDAVTVPCKALMITLDGPVQVHHIVALREAGYAVSAASGVHVNVLAPITRYLEKELGTDELGFVRSTVQVLANWLNLDWQGWTGEQLALCIAAGGPAPSGDEDSTSQALRDSQTTCASDDGPPEALPCMVAGWALRPLVITRPAIADPIKTAGKLRCRPAAILSFRGCIDRPLVARHCSAAGLRSLHRQPFQTEASVLEAQATSLTLIPDGAVRHLAFAALGMMDGNAVFRTHFELRPSYSRGMYRGCLGGGMRASAEAILCASTKRVLQPLCMLRPEEHVALLMSRCQHYHAGMTWGRR